MRAFASFGEIAQFIRSRVSGLDQVEHDAVYHGAEIIQKEAKDSLGHYQGATGPFIAWAELSDERKARRLAEGHSENEPLLASEEMRESIGIRQQGRSASVGSDLEKAEVMERGEPAQNIPARPFLGRAAYVKEHEVVDDLQRRIVGHIIGTTP